MEYARIKNFKIIQIACEDMQGTHPSDADRNRLHCESEDRLDLV